MAKLAIKKASTDVTVYVFIQDSSKTTGDGLTGLTYNTASLVASYVRPLAARAALSLATQTVTGAHSDGGFVEVDATNMPGVYRLDLSDAVCATGVPSVVVMLKGAANMAPLLLEIQLTDFDLNDASPNVTVADIANDAITASVFDESTAFPLKSADTGATQVARVGADSDTLETLSDEIAAVKAETAAILADTGTDGVIVASIKTDVIDAASIKADAITEIQSGLATPTNITAGTIATVTNLTNLPTMPADWITASGLKADAVAEIADGVWDEAMAGHVGAGTAGKLAADVLEDSGTTIPADLVDIENKIDVIATDTTTEIPASITALDGKIDTIDNYIDTEVSAIKAKTDNLPATPANEATLTAIKGAGWTNENLTTIDANVDAVKAKTDNLPSDPADQSAVEAAITAGIGTIPAGITAEDVMTAIVEGAVTLRDSLKLANAMNAGKVSGGNTAAVTFRDLADTLDRIIMTVDVDGNRTVVAKDYS